jgi:hypothetical protein
MMQRDNITLAYEHSLYDAQSSTTSSSEKVEPAKSIRRPRLVDYMQCRRDGTTSSKSFNTKKSNEHPWKTNLKMGLPTCLTLDASLTTMLFIDDEELDASKNKEDRIDFYLKVEPKCRRRNSTRTSSLDTTRSQKEELRQQMASSRRTFDRSQSLGARSTRRRSDATESGGSASYQEQSLAAYTFYISNTSPLSDCLSTSRRSL